MRINSILALTAPGSTDPAVAIAACRAGAVGVLDLEMSADDQAARELVVRLRQFTDAAFGLKVGVGSWELGRWLAGQDHAARPRLIILAGGAQRWVEHADVLRQWKELADEILLECVSVDEAARASELGCAGVILKGHESGGRIGEETSFVLLQRYLAGDLTLPAYVQGGVGRFTIGALQVGGAAGVVLDAQLALTREARPATTVRKWLIASDGSETRRLGESLDLSFRLAAPGGAASFEPLEERLREIEASDASLSDKQQLWREAIAESARTRKPPFLLGQDACFAHDLADQFETVGGVVHSLARAAETSIQQAAKWRPLAEGAPFAEALKTRYPIVQGPMTRVSDTAAFAQAVAVGGGMPFLALALLRGEQALPLLQETQQLLGERTWGVGILGFLPPEIRQEQIEAILKVKPPLALIAGGRPDQASVFEDAGIPTFLHVPSPGLLKMFLRDGGRRFIFEGRECGGHVGPRTSLVLWESMCRGILEHLGPNGSGRDLQIIFAGGIHDARSAAMAACIAAPLVARGVQFGVLMGTAYLFTKEAVDAGAIVERFQTEALRSRDTVLLETGPGHAIRVLRTPYYDDFQAERRRLQAEGRSHEEIVKALEWMNIGRLRVASKGVDRVSSEAGQRKLAEVTQDEQYHRGMYMIGQVAALHQDVTTVAELHDEVASGGQQVLADSAELISCASGDSAAPCDIAVVGMACFYPAAVGLGEYWRNILTRKYSVTEVPQTHWDWTIYYDPDPRAKDKIISKWGGFLGDIPVDPFTYGVTPKSLPSIESLQLLLLECVRHGLGDAGYSHREFRRDRTCAILGIGGGGGPMSVFYGLRSCLPMLDTVDNSPVASSEIMKTTDELLPEWTEDSFPGFLMNVAVGRVANRFDLGGSNYALDAACASSLAAVHACVRELESGTADVALAMGADTVQTPYAYMAFSKTHALSAKGRCRPFDAEADGIVLSEGIGVAVLKRLADAERDGDKIYAVIKGAGSSSDGRDKGLTAPNAAGQLRAIRRAWDKAGVSPAEIGLIEAHGTGTVVGDQTEAAALSQVLEEAGAPDQSCALGSVKSMIGHSKCAAGIAGFIKAAMALHHKVLPPTLVETPSPRINFRESALYLNTETRPWVQPPSRPRRAGVSAFGFGGTNVHIALEEYKGDYLNEPSTALDQWPAEVLLWRAETFEALQHQVRQCSADLADAHPPLDQLAASLAKACPRRREWPVLAIVAESLDQLRRQLREVLAAWEKGDEATTAGVHFCRQPRSDAGKVAFLFPGQGSQYVNMFAEYGSAFQEVREALDRSDEKVSSYLERALARYIYPRSSFSKAEADELQVALTSTDVAQPAVGAVSLGALELLRVLGVRADMHAGHSFGEWTALHAAGALDEDDFLRLAAERGRFMRRAGQSHGGTMAALASDAATAAELIGDEPDVYLANLNAPAQTVISGARKGLERVLQRAQAAKIGGCLLPVACAFHSPLIEEAAAPFAQVAESAAWRAPLQPVYSNVTAAPHADDAKQVSELMSRHMRSPVRFAEQIEAMYADGARTFIEVGPKNVLTVLTRKILGARPHAAVALDQGHSGLRHFADVLAMLLARGQDVDLNALFARRRVKSFSMRQLSQQTGEVKYSPSTWMVNGIRSRPLKGPEPKLIGRRRSAEILPASVTGVPPAGSKASSPKTAAGAKPLAAKAKPNAPLKPAAAVAPPTAKPAASYTAGIARESVLNSPTHSSPKLTQPLPAGPATVAQKPAAPAPSTSRPPRAPSPPVQPPGQESHVVISEDTSQLHASSEDSAGFIGDEETTRVMLGFQNLMSKFLDTQRDVMLSYLGEAPQGEATQPRLPAAAPPLQASVSPASSIRHQGNGAHTANGRAASAPSPTPTAASTAAPTPPAPAPASPAPVEVAPTTIVPDAAASQIQTEVPAVESPSPADPPSPANTAAGLGRDQIEEQLLELVSERTGYPTEMLDMDLDLEADLGIDSIKRVEILGGLAEMIGGGPSDESALSDKLELEKLTTIRTLRGILDYVDQQLFADTETAAPSTASPVPAHAGDNGAAPSVATAKNYNGSVPLEVQRAGVRLVDAPLAGSAAPMIARGAVLVTDDGGGVAADIADRLADFGQKVVLLRHANEFSENEGLLQADLSCPASVAQAVQAARRQAGAFAALIHLAPLAQAGDEPLEVKNTRDVESLYLLSRELQQDLAAAAEQGSAALLATTRLGGGLGLGETTLDAPEMAIHGGILGLVKCIRLEWPDVLVRAIDTQSDHRPADLAELLLAELSDRHGPTEIGYLGRRRMTWEACPLKLDVSGEPLRTLDEQSVVLITGGARGITAVVARDLAARFHCRLILVGRSPAPAPREADDTEGLQSQAEVKARLMDRMRDAGKQPLPAEVEAEYRKLMRQREVRATLNAIEAGGSAVEYHSLDVRDADAFRTLIADVQQRFGRLDGVIHAAGVIEDKLISAKTPESFDRVFGTKVESALSLMHALDPQRLSFLLFFASVAGRYGNVGQGDYAAANEVLCKIAHDLDRRWPARVAAICWGPWEGAGMVADLAKHFKTRGVSLITPELGARFLREEITFGPKGDSEVLVAGGASRLLENARDRADAAASS